MAEDLVHFADLFFIVEVDRCVKVRDLLIGPLDNHVVLAGVDVCPDF